jgi:hypothetical protein
LRSRCSSSVSRNFTASLSRRVNLHILANAGNYTLCVPFWFQFVTNFLLFHIWVFPSFEHANLSYVNPIWYQFRFFPICS